MLNISKHCENKLDMPKPKYGGGELTTFKVAGKKLKVNKPRKL